MRHENLEPDEKLLDSSVEAVDVSSIWPTIGQIAPLPGVEVEDPVARVTKPAEAAPDVPLAAGVMIGGAYMLLISALAFATVGSGKSLFAIVIAFFFACMFFSVPAIFLGIDGIAGRSSLDKFLREGIHTWTGHCGGGAALIQMLIVPVALTLGVLGFGIAAAFIF